MVAYITQKNRVGLSQQQGIESHFTCSDEAAAVRLPEEEKKTDTACAAAWTLTGALVNGLRRYHASSLLIHVQKYLRQTIQMPPPRNYLQCVSIILLRSPYGRHSFSLALSLYLFQEVLHGVLQNRLPHARSFGQQRVLLPPLLGPSLFLLTLPLSLVLPFLCFLSLLVGHGLPTSNRRNSFC